MLAVYLAENANKNRILPIKNNKLMYIHLHIKRFLKQSIIIFKEKIYIPSTHMSTPVQTTEELGSYKKEILKLNRKHRKQKCLA